MTLTESNNKLKKGDVAPDFNLKGADGKNYSLSDFKNAKAVLIIFICNHCPYVQVKLREINRISQDFKEKGVVVIGINSNDSENYPEDSFENMQALSLRGTFNFVYLHDETQEVAKKYGAVCTPDPFLFDRNLKLIFHGAIDDPPGMKEAKNHLLYNAIQEYLVDGKVSSKELPSMGCSIKWR